MQDFENSSLISFKTCSRYFKSHTWKNYGFCVAKFYFIESKMMVGAAASAAVAGAGATSKICCTEHNIFWFLFFICKKIYEK